MSVTEPIAATSGVARMPAVRRVYFAHERAILGTLMVILVLTAWEGCERGWWADLLHPLLGASAERLQLPPIFISSPTLVAAAAFRMFFVTGEIWRDLAWSGLGYALGLGLAIAVGIPLGLAAGWYSALLLCGGAVPLGAQCHAAGGVPAADRGLGRHRARRPGLDHFPPGGAPDRDQRARRRSHHGFRA